MERAVPIDPVTESIRRMVVGSARVPGLHRLYAGLYHAAVRALVREVASSPCTLGIFSRNSYAAGSFVPGRSDIDLTIVIRDDLNPSVVRAYLSDLYLVCERLRRRFPMLDQFPVYTRQGFIAAYRLGPLRLETDAWQCEWGGDDALCDLLEPAVRRPEEAVTRAAQIYVNGFNYNLKAALCADARRSTLAMERSARKIQRALGSVVSESPNADLGAAGPVSEVVARVLMATTRAVESRAPAGRARPWSTATAQGEPPGDVQIGPEPVGEGITGILAPRNGVGSSYVLCAPVTGKAIDSALEIARSRACESSPVVLVTDSLLAFFFGHINPLLYYRLRAARSVRGDDVLARMPAPSEEGVRGFFRVEAARLLRLSTRMGSGQRPADQMAKQHASRRARLLRFLRTGQILPSNASIAAGASRDPQCRDLLDAILGDMPVVLAALSEHADRLAADQAESLRLS